MSVGLFILLVIGVIIIACVILKIRYAFDFEEITITIMCVIVGSAVAFFVLYLIFGVPVTVNDIPQSREVIESRPLVGSYSAQHIEGEGSFLHFATNTGEVYRFYFESDENSIKQDVVPADKTTIHYADGDYRIETIKVVTKKEHKILFLYSTSTEETICYELFVPHDSIVNEFVFN